jgi:predicted AAA+ superfamily ATPase
MYPRFYKPLENQSFFLFGPRATGKTTWLKTSYPESQRIDLLNTETARLLLASPGRLEGMLNKNSAAPDRPIIIDEVQKIPSLLDEVHRLIEDQKLKFILTGSSARKLKRGGANLLAGRALQRFFYPLTCWELGQSFDLQKALQYGLLPNVWTSENPKEFLSTYIYTYLKEEVYAEGLTRSLENFSRFLEYASFSQAQPMTMATLASDVGVNSKLIASHLEVLDDLLLAKQIPVFTKRAKRRMTSHPKFFFFDTGVYRTLRPKGPLDSSSEIDGSALETLFYQHHQALGEFTRWDQQLFYWRTAQKVEVDFVSYGELGLFAFEIKRSPTLRHEELQGLKLFLEDYPMAKCFFLYGGDQEIIMDQIQVLNFEKALWRLPELMNSSLTNPK